MTAVDALAGARERRVQASWKTFGVQAVVVGAVLFNAGLAFVNGHGPNLSSAHVIAAEMMIICSAHVVILSQYRKEMFPWYLLIGFCLLIAIYRSMFTGVLEMKAFRDVLIIPTFLLLGLCADTRKCIRVFLIIHAIVVVFLLMELVATDRFASLFKIKEYYVATRGFKDDTFFNKDSDLFVSATRSGSRFISFLDIHRASSVMLEPPSLGNYCIIFSIFLLLFWREFRAWLLAALIATNILVLIASDSRLATVTTAFMLILAPFGKVLPRYAAAIYVPAVIVAIMIGAQILDLKSGTDDFKGRVAYTVSYLQALDLSEYFGVVARLPTFDSGYANLLLTQTFIGVVVIWLWLVLGVPQQTRRQILASHLVWLYLALNLVVSITAVSIKTHALTWFLIGVVSAETRRRRTRLTGRPPDAAGEPANRAGMAVSPPQMARSDRGREARPA